MRPGALPGAATSCPALPSLPCLRAGTSGRAKRPAAVPNSPPGSCLVLLIWSSMSGTTCRGLGSEKQDCLQGRQMSEAGSRQPGPSPHGLAARSPAGPVLTALRLGWSQQTWAERPEPLPDTTASAAPSLSCPVSRATSSCRLQ